MANFVFDTYTDTEELLLSSHTPETGGAISLHASFTDTISIQSNRAGKGTGSATSVYYYAATPPGLQYTIEGDVVDIGDVARASGICGWIDTSADHMIVARRQNGTTWQFGKIITGSLTSLETVATTFSSLKVTSLKVVRIGDQFSWYIDDVITPGSPHTITDSQFQTAGKVGLRASNSHFATGYHVDNFIARDNDAIAGDPFRVNNLRPRIFAPGLAR